MTTLLVVGILAFLFVGLTVFAAYLTYDPHDDQNRTRIEHRYRSCSQSGRIQRFPDGST
jgi:hypothetical protein